MAKELNARDIKLVQYLNEAYGKEKELETALVADISLTTDKTYKKRLQEHLKETRDHSRRVKKRIKELGGKAEEVSLPGPEAVSEVATGAANLANRAVAAAKGPMHALRGTGEAEKLLKNAKTHYWNEFEEIATYYAIEALAEKVGDKETHSLARSIRRDEERMARFVEKQIPKFAGAVAREEIPAALRSTNGGSRKRSSSRSSGSSNGGGRKKATTRAKSTAKSTAKTAKSTAKTAKTAAKSASTSAKRSRAGAKGGAKRAKSGSRS
jgi:ferritin-like metal-binding protein YciE